MRYPLLSRFSLLANRWLTLAIYLLISVGVTVQRLVIGPKGYNNFLIFKWSFKNLVAGADLYALHPDQYFDLFKYSPTFAACMAPFSVLPNGIGLLTWNLLNALVPYWAVNKLKISAQAKAFILFFVAIELLNSMQSSQSNGLMAGLMIAAFASMEDRKPVLAALFICLGFYVKLFAAAAGLIFLFYDRKLHFLLACAAWGIVLAVLPVVVTGIDGLIVEYKSWLTLLRNDPAHELNFSIMTLTQRWFGVTIPDIFYLAPGVLLLVLPLVRRNLYALLEYRLAFLASVLLWVVIFNHKAESPTYVIAMFGAAIWAITEERSSLKIALLVFVFVLTGLSASDLFPKGIRTGYIVPYCLKALPCIVLWVVVTVQLLSKKFTRTSIA